MFIYTIMKRYATIIGLALLVIGIVSCVLGFLNLMSITTGRSYSPRPLYTINGISVDSRGNIHYGAGWFNSIQVYDNEGNFLYRFSFPVSGSEDFTFYIDNDDIVYVIPRRAGSIFSFKDGNLVNEQRILDAYGNIDWNERTAIFDDFRSRYSREYMDNEGNRYVITSITRRVRMYDPEGNFIRRISPNAPILPLPIPIAMPVGALGIAVIVIANKSFFDDIFRSITGAMHK